MMNLNLPVFHANFLVAIRLSPLLVLSPIQAIRQLPISLRLILLFIISILLVSNLSLEVPIADEATLFLETLAEFANGLTLSMSLYAAFAVFQIAGYLIDAQIGLNLITLFNPAEHSHVPLSSHLLTMLAVLVFFSLNCHHWLIQGLAYSLRLIPPGRFLLWTSLTQLMKPFSLMFSFAFMLASPILIGLLALEICGALLTRNMPQFSSYFLILAIKILFGFLLLAFSLNYLSPVIERIFHLCFQSWLEVIA